MPNLEPYKQSLKSPSLAGCTQLAREWLARCEQSHVECDNEGKSEFEYPIRLIEIIDEPQKLVIADSSRSRSVRYVALSHCWGAAQPFRTCRRNIDKHIKEGISKNELPATFRDASESVFCYAYVRGSESWHLTPILEWQISLGTTNKPCPCLMHLLVLSGQKIICRSWVTALRKQ